MVRYLAQWTNFSKEINYNSLNKKKYNFYIHPKETYIALKIHNTNIGKIS